MHKNRYLDEFTENILESDFSIEAVMKTEILDKTYKKIKKTNGLI